MKFKQLILQLNLVFSDSVKFDGWFEQFELQMRQRIDAVIVCMTFARWFLHKCQLDRTISIWYERMTKDRVLTSPSISFE